MAAIVRLSHIGFNIPRQIFDSECEFWEQVMGLERVHGQDGRNAFFTADRLRDHEFILFAVDEPVASAGQSGCFVNHVAFDVPTAMEVAEFAARLKARGLQVEEHERGRPRIRVVSPAGIEFEVNTPPYMSVNGRDDARQPHTAAARP